MKRTMFLALVFAFTVLLGACASTDEQSLMVKDVWARPGFIDSNSAVFFVIENPGTEDTLLSASSIVASAVELHKTRMQDGVMKMEHQMSVPVPAGETIFKPGGLHVMLIGLTEELLVGDTFEVTLTFASAGKRAITVSVREP